MQVFLGPFHPQLEDAFVSEALRIKKPDPFAPLLVLVPSEAIVGRLKVLLALERQLSLINLSILTFHGLSKRLFEEVMGGADLLLQDDLFFEEIVRHLIKQGNPILRLLAGVAETEGGCAALWQTLRDLKDGLVDPDLALQALKEGHFGKGKTRRLHALFSLYRQFQTACGRAAILGYGDLAQIATQQAPTSVFLSQFNAIFHYGFYDLTQVQIDLFHAVADHYQTILFFPLVKGMEGWSFSEQFYERFVAGRVSGPSQMTDLALNVSQEKSRRMLNLFDEVPAGSAGSDLSFTMINCFDLGDEVLTVAKEIIRLVADEGIPFHEMGVVVREMGIYSGAVKTIFRKHAIPISRSDEEPISQFPLTQAVFLLTALPLNDFPRTQCIDLFSSPYFNRSMLVPQESPLHPDLWGLLCCQLEISKGLKEWEQLKGYDGKRRSGEAPVSPDQADLLLKIFLEVYGDLERLPAEASWSAYSAQWQGLLKKYFLPFSQTSEESLTDEEPAIRKTVLELLQGLANLDRVCSPPTLLEFIEALQRGLSRADISSGEQEIFGVRVMGAASARGSAFQALFLLGMNEGVFPRKIREDALLRDAVRRKLETTLGSKVGEKLAGYDEEKLLFTLLAGGAKKSLYLTYHRLDRAGKQIAPSWYLSEFRRVVAEAGGKIIERTIPRTLQERQSISPFHRTDLLLPSESALRLCLSSRDPSPLLDALPLSSTLYAEGRRALKAMVVRQQMTSYDGLIGPPKDYWEKIDLKGISPTQLEKYAGCPFQFYAKALLSLRSADVPEEKTSTPRSDVGRLCHDILKAFYRSLIQQHYFRDHFKGKVSKIELGKTLQSVSAKVFRAYAAAHRIPYRVAWESLQEQVLELLEAVTAIDLTELAVSGYRPVFFEKKCCFNLEAAWPFIQGRLDRVDIHPGSGCRRVIDYKYTLKKQPTTEDKNLFLAAIRGQRLQPPLYARLAERLMPEQAADSREGMIGSFFYYLSPNWGGGPLIMKEFPKDGWEGSCGEMLRETISALLNGIEAGQFFMNPGALCGSCEVAVLCRKNHLPSRRRLQRDPLFERHTALRQQKEPLKQSRRGK